MVLIQFKIKKKELLLFNACLDVEESELDGNSVKNIYLKEHKS
jgi:hypothetical protein